MRLEEDIKLDYKDVLIRPKRSTLQSRSQVKLHRRFEFRNYKPDFDIGDDHYNGIPIMAANMDGVGTFEMADKLAEGEMFTCLVKTYGVDELVEYFMGPIERSECVAMSIGTTDLNMFVWILLMVIVITLHNTFAKFGQSFQTW